MLEFSVTLTQGGFTLDAALRCDAGVTGLFGPSGSGKSTLLAVLAGLQRPQEGHITLAGETLFDAATGVNWPPHRRRIGVVFQDGRLLPHLGVTANLRFGLSRRATGGPSFEHVVEVLALSGLLSRRVQSLSGGERQRVALGRALLAAPQLLLLDEPLAALDEGMKQQILPFLRRVKEDFKLPMIYVSHAINEILHLTPNLAVMDAGRIIGHGRFSEIIHEDRVLALAHALGLQNVLSLEVVSNDTVLGSTSARHGAQLFLLPLAHLAPGATAHVAVRAENIALALCPAAHTTIHYPARQPALGGNRRRFATHRRGQRARGERFGAGQGHAGVLLDQGQRVRLFGAGRVGSIYGVRLD